MLQALFLLGIAAFAHAGTVKATVTDAAGKPVADAVVFAYEVKEAPKPPMEALAIDQVDKEFVPHQLPVIMGTKVRFPNKDDIHHEIYSFSSAKTFDLPLYKGEPAEPVIFDKMGVVKLGCNIHDWMSGVVLILQNGYFAVTGVDGTAVLDAPDGVEFAVFHERLKGSVDDTKRKPVKGALAWSLKLKAEKKKKRIDITY